MKNASKTGKREWRRRTAVAAASLVLATVGASACLYAGYDSSSVSTDSLSSSDPALRAHSRSLSGDDQTLCSNTPALHDLDPKWVERYDQMIKNDRANFDEYKLPDLVTIDDGRFRTTVRERNWPARSMAWNGTFGVSEDPSIDHEHCEIELGGHGVWREAPTDPAKQKPDRVVKGEYAAFSGWYVGNFGHFVHDHVPAIAWMKDSLPPATKFLLPHHPLHEKIMNVVDADFVRDRVVWIEFDETVQVEGTLTVLVPKKNAPFPCGFPQTAAVLTEHLRAWLADSHRDLYAAKAREPKKVIYYTRTGTTARRNVRAQLEERIISKIRESMAEHGRSRDDLVIFDGKDHTTGETLSIQEQFDLFSSADILIGPHGSGLTNMIWMDPSLKPCGSQNKVIEFASSARTTNVQAGSFSSYWFLFGSMPWIEYHHLYYLSRSTPETVVVDFEAFERALEAAWGGVEVQVRSS